MSDSAPTTSTTRLASTKVPRLSTSCNWCRSHKLKCDTEQPACSNCRRRGTECVTTDLRKGGSIANRVEPRGRHRKRPRDENRFSSTESPIVPTNNIANSPQDACVQSWNANSSPVAARSNTIPSTPDTNVPTPRSIPTSNSGLAIFSLPFTLNDKDHESENGMNARTASTRHSPAPLDSAQISSGNGAEHMTGGIDLTMLTDDCPGRLQMMGISSSLYILIQWLDLFFAQRSEWVTIFPYVRQGMAYTAEMPIRFPVSLPPMPSQIELDDYVSVFSSRVQPIYPVLHMEDFKQSLVTLEDKMRNTQGSLKPADYPSLAIAYAVFSICADEKEGRITEIGTRFLEAAYTLYAHLLAIPYVSSVQALLLITIALRGRNKDGASWGTLGQAIRMAQSIGLHRHIAPLKSLGSTPSVEAVEVVESSDLCSRIWWTAYCLERIMELETGRPSAIQDAECDQILPKFAPRTSDVVSSFDYFEALISLAKLQTQISDRLYRKKAVKRRTEQLLHDSGMLDRALLEWADSLPEGIRPGRDLFWDPDQLHFATFLSLHFHQTVIALHRPALMSGSQQLRERVAFHCSGQPWRFRLRNSMCICAASARSIVKAMNDLVYQGAHSRLITVTPAMLATVVLAIYITKTRFCGMNDADLALLVNCSVYAEEQYIQMGQDPEFIRVCGLIRSQLSDHMQILKLEYQAASSSTGPFTPMSMPQQQHTNQTMPNNHFENEFFEGSEFDELWPYLWGNDLNQVYVGSAESNILNTHLLGLPLSG